MSGMSSSSLVRCVVSNFCQLVAVIYVFWVQYYIVCMSKLYFNTTVCFELETVDKYFCTDPIPSVPVFNCQIPTSLHSPCTKHQFSVLSSHNAFHTLPNILLERMDPQNYHHVEEYNPFDVACAITSSKIFSLFEELQK